MISAFGIEHLAKSDAKPKKRRSVSLPGRPSVKVAHEKLSPEQQAKADASWKKWVGEAPPRPTVRVKKGLAHSGEICKTSAFGIEHLEIGKRDRTAELGAGATAAGAGALVAHKAAGDLRRAAPAHRVGGILTALATSDPAKLASHLHGGVKDAKRLAGLRYARTGLGVAAAGLAGTAVLSRARKQPIPGASPQ